MIDTISMSRTVSLHKIGVLSNMRLGFDGTVWGGAESGVATATRRLFWRFLELAPRYKTTVFAPGDFWKQTWNPPLPNGVRGISCGSRARGWRALWQQFRLPALLRQHNVDVLYCPCYTVPVAAKVRSVVTVHDLIVWKRPDLCRAMNVLHFRSLVGASVKRARYVTVPTESVRDDVREILKVPDEKVRVIPWWVDEEIKRMDSLAAEEYVATRFGIRVPFVLCVGALELKKNIEALIHATRRIDCTLVIVGPDRYPVLRRRRLARLLSHPRVSYLGYTDHLGLSALYSSATIVVVPSHIEGFGLTALEAMACGAPVVTSDAPALVEVCAGAAMTVPAMDSEALYDAIRSMLEDGTLRSRLSEKGLERARAFHWRPSVEKFRVTLEDAGAA